MDGVLGRYAPVASVPRQHPCVERFAHSGAGPHRRRLRWIRPFRGSLARSDLPTLDEGIRVHTVTITKLDGTGLPASGGALTTTHGTSIDSSSETNLAVGNGITLTDDTLTVTAAGGLAQTVGGLTTTGILEDLNTLGVATADNEFIVATGVGVFAYESGSTVRTSLGLGSLATLSDISESNLNINAPTNDYLLVASSTASGGWEWVATSTPRLGFLQQSDLHDAITLTGTPDYITISGQVITRNKLDITDDTNATGGVGIDITVNDFTRVKQVF